MGLKRIKNYILEFKHWIWYGSPKKDCDNTENFLNEEIAVSNGRKEKSSCKNSFENELQRKNWEQWKKGNYKTYGLPRYETNVSEINIVIMEWFKKKWLREESEERVQFYLWLEANYFQGLLEAERNKSKHFDGIYRQYKYSAKMKSIGKVWKWIAGVLPVIAAFFFGKNIDGVRQWIMQNVQSVPQLIRIIGFMTIFIALALVIVYFIRLIFQFQYKANINKINKADETWLRHIEVVAGYQKEVLDYLWDSGEYGQWLCQKDRDKVLVEKIINVWQNNLQKFQYNMKNNQKKI